MDKITKYIIDNYFIIPTWTLARSINKTVSDVNNVARAAGLIKNGNITDEDRQIVKNLYYTTDIIKIMKILSRSAKSIIYIAKTLNICRPITSAKHKLTHISKRLKSIWRSMRSRCFSRESSSYKDYGERGIIICDDWLNPENFYKWAIDNGYSDDLTIERIDVNGNYCPDNCKWIPRTSQQNNTRRSYYITAFGERKTLSDWTKDARCNTSRFTIRKRIKSGMCSELAITLKSFHKPTILINGEEKTLTEWARDPRAKFCYKTMLKKIKNGEDPRTLIIDCVEQNENSPPNSNIQKSAASTPTT